MLVSVLVDRYQRVYTRKRFLNEEYTESMLLNESVVYSSPDEELLDNQVDINHGFNGSADAKDQMEEKKDHEHPPGKVRFVLGYVSDDNLADADQETNKNDDRQLMDSIIGEFFKVKSDQFRAISVDDLRL